MNYYIIYQVNITKQVEQIQDIIQPTHQLEEENKLLQEKFLQAKEQL